MKIRSGRLRFLASGIAILGIAGIGAIAIPTSGGVSAAETNHAETVITDTANAKTATPIKHVVVIFDENVSFDHYFATYPVATNSSGEPFYAKAGTPSVSGLSGALLTANPNGVNPVRFDPANVNNVLTCDQNHNYTPEEQAADGGNEDKYPTFTATATGNDPEGQACSANQVMDYYDGNTVTAEWNYAQHFAMSDENFGTGYGPSTEGALNVISGNTGNVDTDHAVRKALTNGDAVTYTNPDGSSGTTLIGDDQPYWDDCATGAAVAMDGQNIGDQLNAKNLSWGWFEGGFSPDRPYGGSVSSVTNYNQLNNPNAVTCTSASNVGAALGGTGATGTNAWGTTANYSAHYDGFQFYASTANPHHIAPTSLKVVGTDTAATGEFNTANHNYDVSVYNQLLTEIKHGKMSADHMPAVSYLKAPVYETGHPATSDPADEQTWLVNEINLIESLPTWKNTAIFVTYDDSDGWYDNVYGGIADPSDTTADSLTGTGACGTVPATGSLYDEQGRCGPGPRLPLIVISPFAKQNYVSNAVTNQSSIIAFIENNWNLGQIAGSAANTAGPLTDLFNFSARGAKLAKPLTLNPKTGEPNTKTMGAIFPSAGPLTGGTVVTINGMNLNGRVKVTFGGKEATDVKCGPSKVLLAPADTCTAVVPASTSSALVPLVLHGQRVLAQSVGVSLTDDGQAVVNDAGDYDYR